MHNNEIIVKTEENNLRMFFSTKTENYAFVLFTPEELISTLCIYLA